MFHLSPVTLPAFSYGGVTFDAKSELHCSLLYTQELAKYFKDPELAADKLADFVKTFVTKHPIEFEKFTRNVYTCEKDNIQSVIIEVTMRGVDELYAALRATFAELAYLPGPALHVTLYKYNHQFGIGIQNAAELREFCTPLSFERLPKQLQEQL